MEINPHSPEIRTPAREIPYPKGHLRDLDFAESTMGFHSGPNRRRGYRLILFSWAASLIDVLLGVAFSSFFILTSSVVLRVNMFRGIPQSGWPIVGLGIFVASVAAEQILLRIFLGFTIGEWACGLRLGSSKERAASNYALRVLLRSLVNLFSGFVLLPILSLIVGQDLSGRISGLYLVSQD